MSKRIKGVTIEIEGKTTKLQSALKEVDSQLSKTQSALRDTNKLLKLNPGNTELIAQKQKQLAEAVKGTCDRLKVLKEAAAQAEQALANGTGSTEEYDALQREIIETENSLERLKKQASSVGLEFDEAGNSVISSASKLDEFSKKASSIGDKATEAGKKLMPLSATAEGVAVATTKMAVDFENSMAQINTLLSDNSHMQMYEDSVKSLSAETGMSLETMASGMYQAISSLGDGGKETTQIFEVMATSARAGGAEVSDAVSLISAGMKGYNSVNKETAKQLSDLAFQTAKLGVTTFPEMARAMQPLFPLASSLNVSYEELFGTMATLTGVTGNTAEVTTQLKAVFSNLMKPTGAMTTLLQEYGYANAQAMLEAEGLGGVLEILQKATGGQADKLAELFGSTEAVTAITALTGAQFDSFREKTQAMSEATGATAKAYDKLQTSGFEVQQSIQQLKVAGLELGEGLLTLLAPAISAVADAVSTLVDWFLGLNEGTQKFISLIVLITGAIAPALLIFGQLSNAVAVVIPIVAKLGTMFASAGTAAGVGGAGVALFSSPLLPLVAIIGGVVAAGVLLYKNWDSIKEHARQFKEDVASDWEAIKSKTSQTWQSIKDAIMKPIQTAQEKVKSAIDKIKGFFNFTWSLPKLKMPHPKVSGKFSLNPPSVPHFSIDWYKKAMSEAYMLTGATIFGQRGGNLLGGGEAGSEMVIGTSHLLKMIQKASNASNLADVCAVGFSDIYSILSVYLPQLANKFVVLDTGEIVGAMAPHLNVKFAKMQRREGRA